MSVEFHICISVPVNLISVPIDTGRKLSVHKTFNLHPVSTGVGKGGRNGLNVINCKFPIRFRWNLIVSSIEK